MNRTQQLRQAQALYKERKKQNGEHRIDLHLSKQAYETLLSITQQTGLTRSMYVTHLLEGIEIQKQSPVLQKTPVAPLAQELESTGPNFEQEIALLKKKLQDQTYWFDRVSAVNEVLAARVRELEKQSSPAIPSSSEEH